MSLTTADTSQPYPPRMADDRKTKPTDASADELIAGVEDERRRADAEQAIALVREVTGVSRSSGGRR